MVLLLVSVFCLFFSFRSSRVVGFVVGLGELFVMKNKVFSRLFMALFDDDCFLFVAIEVFQ